MALTRKEWNAKQAKLPVEDRTSYEEYLGSAQAVQDTARSIAATPAPKPAAPAAPTTPVNPIAAAVPTAGVVSTLGATAEATPTVTPTVTPTPVTEPIQYATSKIYDRNGKLVEVYSEGPQAGYSVDGGELVIQGETPEVIVGGGTGLGGGGTLANIMAGLGGGPVPSEKTMAIDTFKNTLALYFGKSEMSQPWVNAMYNAVSKYYKTGSTIDEGLNLALQDVRNNPELSSFTKRFKGLYELQDKVAKGEAIEMPTIAEFYKSQQALGDIMRSAGFQDLATQEFLGDVLGTGKSVAETTALITDVFAAIDNAPEALKKDLAMVAPGADRTSIAKALLLGKQGAAALNKQIAATTVFSAAKSQGVNLDMGTAADYAARGFDYNETLATAGNIARGMKPYQKLTEISTGAAVKPEAAQATMQQALFENNVAAQEKIRLEAEKEAARYGGRSGTMGSRSLASRNRANRPI